MTLPDPLSGDAVRETTEAADLRRQLEATRKALRLAINELCDCGGAGPGEGCKWCDVWHGVHLSGDMGRETIADLRARLDAVCAAATALLDTNDIAEQWAAEKRLREAVAEARKS